MARIVTPVHPYVLAGVLDVGLFVASIGVLATLITTTVILDVGVLVLGGGVTLIMAPGILFWWYAARRTAANRGYWFPLDAVTVRALTGSSWAYLLSLVVISVVLIKAIEDAAAGTLTWFMGGVLLGVSLPSIRLVFPLILEQLQPSKA